MKNIFKKNQIIITALAIMIVIAGYLSFTNNDKPDSKNSVETNSDLDGVVTDLNDSMDLAQETTDDATTGDTTAKDAAVTDDTTVKDQADDTDVLNTTGSENDETTPVGNETADANELGDISDEDVLVSANDVSDTGELDLEDGVPGEAVLASTTLEAGYFISNKMEREQMRARNKDTYLEVMEDPDIAEALKQDAVNRMMELTEVAEKENATEILLKARGFEDALVSINDGKVDVIINAESISDQQLAIIEEVVKNKTEISVANMSIVPVVMEE